MAKSAVEMTAYAKVRDQSAHGALFSIEDDDDVDVAQDPTESLDPNGVPAVAVSTKQEPQPGEFTSIYAAWNTLTFAWMQDLLKTGNAKPLDLDDLYQLPDTDRGEAVYKRFKRGWNHQLREAQKPSLTWAFVHSFGRPFIASAFLKLVHDSCLFIGPLLLNKIIHFLSDPSQPMSVGLYYVLGLFLANFVMSLCLRQYFWWCYRVGMNLRAAIVTAVYNKSLVVCQSTMSQKTTGEISNLMAVDSSRLQDLTPYLHALWYSFFQIVLALIFLWRQLGVSCLAGMLVIMIGIPITSMVSGYMKTLQKQLSKIRDERIKLTNEVLSGMKVIKLQAWEGEFHTRIQSVRSQEQAIFRQYTISQAMSGALYTAIPLVVAILTFLTFIALGNELDVATALTSLALFDLLRFPLFMLPQVLNNVVEAGVSVERVQSFLLEPERVPVPAYPLKEKGVVLHHATCVYEGALIKKFLNDASNEAPALPSTRHDNSLGHWLRYVIGRVRGTTPVPPVAATVTNPLTASSPAAVKVAAPCGTLTTEAKQVMIKEALLREAEERIDELEKQVHDLRKHNDESKEADESDPFLASLDAQQHRAADELLHNGADERLLTLSRISMHGKLGELICIVGQVGSGKTSVLQSLLGNLMQCHGTIALFGRVAYTAQLPYITNSTLRDNILYGEPFNYDKYIDTLHMSALLPDLAVLPAGDQTEIGERGINLSGGQKARVGLARAVYSDADIYVMDDPLSAVDAHVGLHLYENCIVPLVRRGKLVLLVTNALHYVNKGLVETRVVVLKEGKVVDSGRCEDVLQHGGIFTDMMNTMQDSVSSSTLTSSQIAEGGASSSPVPKATSHLAQAGAGVPKGVHLDGNAATSTGGKLTSAEDREVGNVTTAIYMSWARAAGGLLVGVIIICNFYGGEFVSVLASWWLSYWSEQQDTAHPRSPWFYLAIYSLINVLVVVMALIKEIYVRLRSLNASQTLFSELVTSVLYAPMAFFDTTPLGRVINRFSKDIYTIDEQIPQTVRSYLSTVAKVTGVLLYICIVTPLFVVGLLPIAAFYILAQRYYIKTSRELTRIEGVTRSPIYALFSETLDGLATIRAYGSEGRLSGRNNVLLDNNQRAYFLNFSANCWLAVRLEFIGTLIVTCSALFAVMAKNYHDESGTATSNSEFAGLAGLSISLALSVTQSLNWTVRMASDMESQMVSVERVRAYAQMPQEPSHYLPTDPPVMAAGRMWPSQGAIRFENVAMRYRPGLPLVLQGLSINIEATQKVGIVGRTGAGKSSLLTALLRLVELESGRIVVDGIDILSLGLHALRSAMAVIPQDPVLFSGTVRSNLDPFNKYTDTDIWEAISRCLLSSAVTSLDDKVSENGSNFSVGQRQLLCIARALLARAKIIIMDEATAAVDVETDALIQRAIRTEFAHATCLTVAHRLNTIMDSDKVLVMDAGRAAEFDSPANLLANDQSLFYGLVNNWEASSQ